jgi:hypothetical protein
MKTQQKYFALSLLICLHGIIYSQQKVGVNTTTPVRTLEVRGVDPQYTRMHVTTSNNSTSGIEFVRGDDNSGSRDFKLENKNGILSLLTNTDNFTGASTEFLRLDEDGDLGIGTLNPLTPLHIEGGEPATNTQDGYLLIGAKTGANLVMGDNGIIARNNGSPAGLYIQGEGGNTWFGDGNVYMGIDGDGKMNVGTAPLNARLSVADGSYQLHLVNTDGNNDWYIGASDYTWGTGDDYLLFSPTSSHTNARLRLKNVGENDGIFAPVIITAPSNQSLLLDGNEIDAASDPLYINNNSNENIYLNPYDGKVGIGTSSPSGKLTVKTDGNGLGLQRGFDTWWISPQTNGEIRFYKNTDYLAYVTWAGEWVALSDRHFKENIVPMENVLDKIRLLRPVSYTMIQDKTHRPDIGVIAQEVQQVFPEVVSTDGNQLGVAYDQLTVIALKGIQEQQAKLLALNAKVDALLDLVK